MMGKRLLSFLALALTSSICLASTLTPMSKSQVTSALNNKTITTISAATLNGQLIADSFTGFFNKDGTVTGKFTNKPDTAPQEDRGKWMVKPNGMVCVAWDHWNDAKNKCFSFYKLHNALLIVNTNNSFESLILDSGIKTGNQM